MSAGMDAAGFDVLGVDIAAQPRYPFEFEQADALTFEIPSDAVYVHASPPCQFASKVTPNHARGKHENLIPATRVKLQQWARETGGVWTIENVSGKVLDGPTMYCGGAVGLPVKRHRYFESNVVLISNGCVCGANGAKLYPEQHGTRGKYLTRFVSVAGSTGGRGGIELRRAAMEMPWASGYGCAQAIPPAMGEVVAHQMFAAAMREVHGSVALTSRFIPTGDAARPAMTDISTLDPGKSSRRP